MITIIHELKKIAKTEMKQKTYLGFLFFGRICCGWGPAFSGQQQQREQWNLIEAIITNSFQVIIGAERMPNTMRSRLERERGEQKENN